MANKGLLLPSARLFNNSNRVAPGATATLYLSGTSTLTNFLDAEGVALGPTITADGLGQLPSAYQDENTAFRLIVRDALGVQLDGGDIDPFYFGRDNSVLTTAAGSSVSTRNLLAAISNPVALQNATLTETGREGAFVFDSSDLSAEVTADTAQGLYVAPSSDTTGASGAWVRVWDKVNGRPEWFGAVPDDPGVDNSAAIQACIDLCPTTKLSAGTYYIGSGAAGVGTTLLTVSANGKRVVGAGATQSEYVSGASDGNSTEIVVNSASATAFLVGHALQPAAQADWTTGAVLKDFMIRRNVGTYTLGNPATGTTDAPCAVKLWWANTCILDNVYTQEHSFGFWITGTVGCRVINCRHLRYTAGANIGNDFFAAIFQDNSAASGYNSGNASLYILGGGAFSNEAAGVSYTYNAGLQSYQGFTDTYIIGFETANCGYGVDMNGRSSAAVDWQTEDLTIAQCVFDGCRWDGVRVQFGGPKTAVQIVNNYIAASNATGPVSNGIHIEECHGSINIADNQMIANVGNPANGIYVHLSSGVVTSGNIITDYANPEVWDSVVIMRVEGDHINASAVAPAVAGIQLTNCQNGYVAPVMNDSVGTNVFPKGVDLLGAQNSKIEINCTNIYSGSLSGGSANKLVANGTQITATGAFNAGVAADCLASGIMA